MHISMFFSTSSSYSSTLVSRDLYRKSLFGKGVQMMFREHYHNVPYKSAREAQQDENKEDHKLYIEFYA